MTRMEQLHVGRITIVGEQYMINKIRIENGKKTLGKKRDKWLWVMDEMNDFRSWAQGSKQKEWLWVIYEMNDSRSWAQGSKRKEWL